MTDQELIQALRCCAEGECKGCAVYADKQSCQENILAQAADRLEGRIKAYGDGRIVVLPCKVGDELWTNISICGDRYRQSDRPYRVKVVFIGLGLGSTFFHVEYSNGRVFPVDKEQFGKTVFRTREEAEKALEGQKNGNKADM